MLACQLLGQLPQPQGSASSAVLDNTCFVCGGESFRATLSGPAGKGRRPRSGGPRSGILCYFVRLLFSACLVYYGPHTHYGQFNHTNYLIFYEPSLDVMSIISVSCSVTIFAVDMSKLRIVHVYRRPTFTRLGGLVRGHKMSAAKTKHCLSQGPRLCYLMLSAQPQSQHLSCFPVFLAALP